LAATLEGYAAREARVSTWEHQQCYWQQHTYCVHTLYLAVIQHHYHYHYH